MNLVIGKRYFGPHDAARIVTSVDGDTVTWMSPASLGSGSDTIAAFQAWALESDRRNYIHRDGSRRIKIEETNPVIEDEAEVRPAGVVWVSVDTPYDRQWSTADDWAAWRAGAE